MDNASGRPELDLGFDATRRSLAHMAGDGVDEARSEVINRLFYLVTAGAEDAAAMAAAS